MQKAWHELSGGETKRVALAARLIIKPKVLLLDEPFANIDLQSQKIIRETLSTLKKNNQISIILSSHDHAQLQSCSDELFNLR